jgi:myo-inositol-1(or 4)-monophosphatase
MVLLKSRTSTKPTGKTGAYPPGPEESMLKKIERIVRRAGKMMLSAQKRGIKVHAKEGEGNYVTDTDEAIQRFLQRKLKWVLPQAAFVGEESGADAYRKEGLCFIVDPIDGTANFIRSLRCSVVSVGLAQDGAPKLGVVYNPYSGELFSAERGKGAFCNGRPIRVSGRPLREAIVSFGATIYQRDLTERMFGTLRGMFDRCEDLRLFSSAANDICLVAAGRLDAFVELRLYPWDYAGAMCVLQEAGGTITTTEGGRLPLDAPSAVLAAGTGCYDEALEVCRRYVS